MIKRRDLISALMLTITTDLQSRQSLFAALSDTFSKRHREDGVSKKGLT